MLKIMVEKYHFKIEKTKTYLKVLITYWLVFVNFDCMHNILSLKLTNNVYNV